MKITEKLQQYAASSPVSFAMPGHKMKNLSPVIDVTELDATVDLHHNSDEVRISSRMLADFYGADDSLYLVGGATSGIFTMLYSVCRPGDTIAVGRACHKAVMNACIFLGIKMILIPQKVHPIYQIPQPPEPEAVQKTMESYSDIRAVLITSPDYYGVCADVKTIAGIVHRHRIPLLVDEAHGAHFKVSRMFPKSAMELGADMAVQSAHKTLGALTPSAFLHIKRGLVIPERVRAVSAMVQTSSPPYYIVSSAERVLMDVLRNGSRDWEAAAKIIEAENKRLKQETDVLVMEEGVRDITRIVFGFLAYQTTGTEIARILHKRFGIDVEMADICNVVCIATAYNTGDEIRYLYRAIKEICKGLELCKRPPVLKNTPEIITKADPGRAFYAQKRRCRIESAAGHTAASLIGAYPPGIPVIYMGETVRADVVEYIQYALAQGVKVQGIQDFQVVK